MAMADDRTSGRGETERQFATAQNIELAVDGGESQVDTYHSGPVCRRDPELSRLRA